MRSRVMPFCWVATFTSVLLGCEPRVEVNNPLQVSSEQKAQQLIRDFFGHYVQLEVDDAVALLCEQNPAERTQAAQFIRTSQSPSSRFRVDAFQVRSALAHWVGREPYYWVDVAFPRVSGGHLLHAYRVRVRDGCIENFLGTSAAPQAPPPSLSVPAAAPQSVPQKTTPPPASSSNPTTE